jgi:hypothetical protein
MSDYWTSTKSPTHIFRKPKFYESPENEAYLRENYFIDAAQLAIDLRISETTLKSYQRRLGLRKFRPNNKKYRHEDWQ